MYTVQLLVTSHSGKCNKLFYILLSSEDLFPKVFLSYILFTAQLGLFENKGN